MARMSMREALDRVMVDIQAMTPEQLRAEMDKHRDGPVACALRDARATLEFMCNEQQSEG